MATNIHVGVGGVARKVKSAYVGVNGVARKVKKGYIGVGSIARQFMQAEITATHIDGPQLTYARRFCAVGQFPTHLTIAGGLGNGRYENTIEYYNASLTHGYSGSKLVEARGDMGYVMVANKYLICAYGARSATGSNPKTSTAVEAITAMGVYKVINGASNSGAVKRGIGGSVGDYGLIMGAITENNIYTSGGTYYNSSLSSGPIYFPFERSLFGSANAGNYLLFAGGHDERKESTPAISDVISYDVNLTRGTTLSLSSARDCTGASINGYAVFAKSSVMDIFNSSLTRLTPITTGNIGTGLTVDKYILYQYSRAITIYNSAFLNVGTTTLIAGAGGGAAGTIGGYAIYAGGAYPNGTLVDILKIS